MNFDHCGGRLVLDSISPSPTGSAVLLFPAELALPVPAT